MVRTGMAVCLRKALKGKRRKREYGYKIQKFHGANIIGEKTGKPIFEERKNNFGLAPVQRR
jgi:hypothetical protein